MLLRTASKSLAALFYVTILLVLFWGFLSAAEVQFLNRLELLIYCTAIYIAVRMVRSEQQALNFTFALSLGLLVFSTLLILNTMRFFPPPYYSILINPISGEETNSPGVANRAALFFVFAGVALSNLRLGSDQKDVKWRLYLFGLLFAALWAFYIGVVTGSRTFVFLVGLTAVFLVLNSKEALGNVVKVGLACAVLIALDSGLIALSVDYENSRDFIIDRILEQGLESERSYLTAYWYQEFLSNPLKPVPFPTNSPTSWFHNFWIDFQSEAGTVAFSLLILQNIIGMVTFARFLPKSENNALQWSFFLIAVLLVLYTTVEWLSGSFYLTLVALFLVSARLEGLNRGNR